MLLDSKFSQLKPYFESLNSLRFQIDYLLLQILVEVFENIPFPSADTPLDPIHISDSE